MSVGKINVTQALSQVEDLLLNDRSISPAARAMLQLLTTIIHLLSAKLGLNSSNSSVPPSQDPHRQRGSKGKAKENGRKPGGQKGHRGTTLQPVANPDKIEPIGIDRRTLPPGEYKDAGYEPRQVFEILITSYVVEYRAQVLEDAWGRRFVAEFPVGRHPARAVRQQREGAIGLSFPAATHPV